MPIKQIKNIKKHIVKYVNPIFVAYIILLDFHVTYYLTHIYTYLIYS